MDYVSQTLGFSCRPDSNLCLSLSLYIHLSIRFSNHRRLAFPFCGSDSLALWSFHSPCYSTSAAMEEVVKNCSEHEWAERAVECKGRCVKRMCVECGVSHLLDRLEAAIATVRVLVASVQCSPEIVLTWLISLNLALRSWVHFLFGRQHWKKWIIECDEVGERGSSEGGDVEYYVEPVEGEEQKLQRQ
jgi:hypothetical protein